jgi:type IV secretory pathway TraG/TraD family ATPase VirD4
METDENPFDMAELASGKVTIYLVLPPDRLQTHGRWLRMLLTLAIRTMARQSTPPEMPVLFMLDEMGTIGALSMIEQSYGLMAGLGIRLWGFLQDLPQLQRDYPNSWETFISNSSILQALNVGDLTTSKYFSEYIGNKTIEVNKGFSKHTRPNEQNLAPGDPNRPKSAFTAALAGAAKGVGGVAAQNATSYAQREVWEPDLAFHSRPLLFPWEVRAVPKTASLIIAPGRYNAQLDRFTYYSDPVFSRRARQDPNKAAATVQSPAPPAAYQPPPPPNAPPQPPRPPAPTASDTLGAAAEKLGGFLNRLGNK